MVHAKYIGGMEGLCIKHTLL